MSLDQHEAKRIIRPLHIKDRLPFYSMAELLIPFSHPVFIPGISKPRTIPRTVRSAKSDLRKVKIEQLLAEGCSTLEIANALGISAQATRDAFKRYGLELPVNQSEFMRENGEAIKKYCREHGVYKTSKHFGKHYLTIKNYVERV